jgi:dTMP kinase
MKKKGKLIVIEGTDGSGKATQAKILLARLKKMKKKVAFLDFPQYGKPTCASVEKYLNGKYGSVNEVGPYKASIFYAVDRYDASFKLKKWLSEGRMVIANRYVASNLAHQGGKISDAKKRKHYLDWIENLEYGVLGIPQPNMNIVLFVDPKISQKLVDSKGKRAYLGSKKRDIHEADLSHLKNTSRVYLELHKKEPKKYQMIRCTQDGSIMTREQIANLVWKKVKTIVQ